MPTGRDDKYFKVGKSDRSRFWRKIDIMLKLG